MDIFEEQFELDKKRMNNLSDKEKNIYSLMALERQWKVYEKGSKGYNWNRSDVYRQLLDQCWETIIENRVVDEGLWNICVDNKPTEIMSNIAEQIDDISTFSLIFADNLSCFIEGLLECGVAIRYSLSNFDFLESFLYEYLALENNEESKEIFWKHELVQLEIMRQERDYERIHKCGDFEKLREWYRTECAESILGEYWFNSNFIIKFPVS